MQINEAVSAGYLILLAVLLFIRYSMVYRYPRVMFLILWLCMYIFLTARLSLCNFYGQLSKMQYISIQVLTLAAGLVGAIVRSAMEEGRELNAGLI